MVLPPAPLRQPSPGGVAPPRPSHSSGPSRLGLASPDSAPHTSRASGALPRTTRPSRLRWRRSRRKAHTSLKLVASSLPRLPPLRLPDPEPGRPMPAPAPPGWLHKVAEKPPPARACSEGLEGFLGSAGSAAPAMCPTSRARRTAGRVTARRTHSLSPLQPAPPSTHLSPGPTESGQGSLGPGFSALRAPPGPRPRSPISEGQSVRRLSPAAPATCPKFRCPAHELRLPPPPVLLRPRATGEARRVLPSRCRRRRRRSGCPARGRRLRCHRAPRPAPGLPLSIRTHFPPCPAEGSTRPPRGPTPPCSAPRGPTAAPAGKCSPSAGSAKHAGICSPTLWALACVQGPGI